ncbi:translation initiation factor IF-2 [Parapedobacter pyrenivorans]|uniref:Translation initiation factor IF-2 n=1 Tax=Parapedobacter pyrenivorans TaxID=1305674 RepID=A0A917MA39_9SPHI|nr:translation initiation factor IF-2 [Parapedobacter pyrenivorans]GGG88720.1 translation initiation factor IF-2 [Parapedobacter pyrenivorans]
MSEGKSITLLKAAKELNIGIGTAVDFLAKSGYEIESKPGTKLDSDTYDVLLREFQGDKIVKEEANQIIIGKIRRDESPSESVVQKPQRDSDTEEILIKNTGAFTPEERQVPTPDQDKDKDQEKDEVSQVEEKPHVSGMKIVGKIDLANLKGGKPQKETPKEEITEKGVPLPSEADVQKEPVNIQEEPVPAETKVPEVEESSKEPVEEKPEQQPVVAETTAVEPIPEVPQVAAKQEEGKADIKENVRQPHSDVIRARAQRLTGPNVVGRIDLAAHQPKEKPVASSSSSGISSQDQKRKRKRKDKPTTQQRPGTTTPGQHGGPKGRPDFKGKPRHTTENREEPTEKEIQDQIKATLARLSGAGKSGKFAQRAKLRRQKRDDIAQSAEEAALEQEMMSKVLRVTEFVTANDLANMMGVQVTQIIATCMSLGLFVSINQRLDAETIAIVADEFGYEIEFVKPEDEENTELEESDNPENLIPRAPIVTVMGHVDHGKTSLLDYVRKTNVIGGEAGGITQHIGAYEVTLDDGRKLTFLDTPGHEAFTAMRARGAKVTDIAIIVIAADDSVMPQTKEAINHAQAAGVPIVFAFTKIDKPGASADKIREQLSTMNILVEDWGGKYQCQEISGKTGENVDLLLEKVLLEAEMLELTADPGKRAVGSVIEASLDKGRGIVTTVLIQSGTLRVGAPILAGSHSGKVKALYNERGQKVTEAGPATPVQILGMSGAPTAGDKFYEMESEVEARQVANKRLQLQREQGLRTQKHITLDEIGRRLAIGNFKELNVIVKGDVDGSIEALSDSLLKLSTEEIQVNVIHKSVGQISESDVLLASASDAIIIGFQVRPSTSARKLAEQEQIDIRLYSIIYDAIEEVKAAMEGMLEPKYEEKIVANVEIRETFKITKVGTIAGCMVLDGKINRNHSIRVIRDGVVVHTGQLASLKRFKDDVKEVSTGYECGLNIQNFNDIKEGDIIEAYEQVEVKRKL